MTAYDDQDEAPLDPAAERLRRKLSRLLLVSGGIMLAGFLAVILAIIYKLGALSPAEPAGLPAAAVDARIPVPPGTRILTTAVDAERALLTLEGADGERSLVLIDLKSGEVLGRYRLVAE